jgi:hypothetical protein
MLMPVFAELSHITEGFSYQDSILNCSNGHILGVSGNKPTRQSIVHLFTNDTTSFSLNGHCQELQ